MTKDKEIILICHLLYCCKRMFLVYKKLMAIGVGVLDKNSLAPLKRADMCNMMNDKGQKLTSIC